MGSLVSLSVTTEDSTQRDDVFRVLSMLAHDMGERYPGVSVSSHRTDEAVCVPELSEECDHFATLIYNALRDDGVDGSSAREFVVEMQNAGILTLLCRQKSVTADG